MQDNNINIAELTFMNSFPHDDFIDALANENFGSYAGASSLGNQHGNFGVTNSISENYNINIYVKIFKIFETIALQCSGQELDNNQLYISNLTSYKSMMKYLMYEGKDINSLNDSDKKIIMSKIMILIPLLELKLGLNISGSLRKISNYSFLNYIYGEKDIKCIDKNAENILSTSYNTIFDRHKKMIGLNDINFGKIVSQDGETDLKDELKGLRLWLSNKGFGNIVSLDGKIDIKDFEKDLRSKLSNGDFDKIVSPDGKIDLKGELGGLKPNSFNGEGLISIILFALTNGLEDGGMNISDGKISVLNKDKSYFKDLDDKPLKGVIDELLKELISYLERKSFDTLLKDSYFNFLTDLITSNNLSENTFNRLFDEYKDNMKSDKSISPNSSSVLGGKNNDKATTFNQDETNEFIFDSNKKDPRKQTVQENYSPKIKNNANQDTQYDPSHRSDKQNQTEQLSKARTGIKKQIVQNNHQSPSEQSKPGDSSDSRNTNQVNNQGSVITYKLPNSSSVLGGKNHDSNKKDPKQRIVHNNHNHQIKNNVDQNTQYDPNQNYDQKNQTKKQSKPRNTGIKKQTVQNNHQSLSEQSKPRDLSDSRNTNQVNNQGSTITFGRNNSGIKKNNIARPHIGINKVLWNTVSGNTDHSAINKEDYSRINDLLHQYVGKFGANNEDMNNKYIEYIKNNKSANIDDFVKNNKSFFETKSSYGTMYGNKNYGEKRHYPGYNQSHILNSGSLVGNGGSNGGGKRVDYFSNNSNNMKGIFGWGKNGR